MSAYRTNKTQFKNARVLKKLLLTRYKEVETHDTPQTLIDYRGKSRPEKAEIIIRRKIVGGAANDIGFRKTADGTYEAIISEYDGHKQNKKWMDTLAKEYAEDISNEAASDNNCELESRQVLPNGGVRLRYVVNNNL